MKRTQKRRARFTGPLLTVLFLFALLGLGSVTASSQETPQSKESTLTEAQLRQGLRDSLDALKDAREKSKAANDHVVSLEKENADKTELIQEAKEKARIQAELVAEKEAHIKDIQTALAKSEQRTQVEADGRAKAEKEVTHQKRKVHFWKRVAEVTGTAAVVAIGIVVLSH